MLTHFERRSKTIHIKLQLEKRRRRNQTLDINKVQGCYGNNQLRKCHCIMTTIIINIYLLV